MCFDSNKYKDKNSQDLYPIKYGKKMGFEYKKHTTKNCRFYYIYIHRLWRSFRKSYQVRIYLTSQLDKTYTWKLLKQNLLDFKNNILLLV